MQNRLSDQKSLYLQQHKDNPVHWQAWDEDSLKLARDSQKPIFLSIGYSSCHWCHVMEAESFSQEEVAKILNKEFIPIKLDREERPDIDNVYMKAVQAMTGQGGWPLNVFLTPDLRPFFGGTYFPPEPRHNLPAFKDLLQAVSKAFKEQVEAVQKNADSLVNVIFQSGRYFEAKAQIEDQLLEAVNQHLEQAHDANYGGFGPAPKFFYTDAFRLWLRQAEERRELAEESLSKIINGGIYDHLAGGFHRYSTDAEWKVPHFEKMLYDNALLTRLLVEACRATGNQEFKRVANECIDWAFREMRGDHGAFYSAIDADTDEGEGAYYTWAWSELKELLDKEVFDRFSKRFNCKKDGNFEDRNILFLSSPLSESERLEFSPALNRLYEARKKRTAPQRDLKVQTSWNGLMISALCQAGRVFSQPSLIQEAERTAQYILETAYPSDRLLHISYGEEQEIPGMLEDYAYFGIGLLDLFEVTGKSRYLERLRQLGRQMITDFYDSKAGGFWSTAEDQGDVIVRTKEVLDSALPSPYHIAAELCLRLYQIDLDKEYYEAFERSTKAVLGSAEKAPGGFQSLALALRQHFFGTQLVVRQSDWEPKESDWQTIPLDTRVFIRTELVETKSPLIDSKKEEAFYLCREGSCEKPVSKFSELSFGLVDQNQ